jgi:hypothetical protein
MVSMNKLTIQKQVQVLVSLVEGSSIRSTVRMTGVTKNTIVKLLRDNVDNIQYCSHIFMGKSWGIPGMPSNLISSMATLFYLCG